MKKEFIEFIGRVGDISMTALPKSFPQSAGDKDWTANVQEGLNPNVYIAFGMNSKFHKMYNKLKDEKIIMQMPCNALIPMMDGGVIPTKLPIATNRRIKGDKPCWMPMLVKKGLNFPKDKVTFKNPFKK